MKTLQANEHFFRALAFSGINLNRSDSCCIFFVYDARMLSAVSSLEESIGLLLRVIDDRGDPCPFFGSEQLQQNRWRRQPHSAPFCFVGVPASCMCG